MEYIRMRDNSTSPDPTEHSAASFAQADSSLLTPSRGESDAEYPPSQPLSTANSPHAERCRFLRFKPPPLEPVFRGFERPSFYRIVALTLLCLIAYPAFCILTIVVKDKSLFVVRLIVSAWCSGAGFAFGYILLKIGTQHLEAATWATVIHTSHNGGGMKLRDLAKGSGNPTRLLSAFHIFRSRFNNQETARGWRKSYDKRPWSLLLGLFVILAILAPLLPFLFGRIMEIKTFESNQSKEYREGLIAGDLTKEDVDRMARHLDTLQFGWQSYGRSTFQTTQFVYNNDTVYFAQPSLTQFTPGGFGPGTLNQSDTSKNSLVLTGRDAPKRETGAVIRHPQWGIRVHCERLPDPKANLIPASNRTFTYVFLPRDFLRGMFAVYDVDLPTKFAGSDLSQFPQDDTIPSNIDPSTISYMIKFLDDSVVDLRSLGVDALVGDQGWVTLETVLIQVRTKFTPSGRFPVYFNRVSPFSPSDQVGYDAAVCVQKYESWIIETWKTSVTSPSVLRIVGKGDGNPPLSPRGNIRGTPIANTRYLNTTGSDVPFTMAHQGATNQTMKDIYYPTWTSPGILTGTAISLTGDERYTELSLARFASTRARYGAAHVLPYLVGSGHVVAQVYEDETLAYVTYKQWQLIGLPILIWILGIVGELFVPTLPLGVPRREFGVYSWLALFQFQELQFEAADDPVKLVNLNELEERFSGKRVKFVVEKGGG